MRKVMRRKMMRGARGDIMVKIVVGIQKSPGTESVWPLAKRTLVQVLPCLPAIHLIVAWIKHFQILKYTYKASLWLYKSIKDIITFICRWSVNAAKCAWSFVAKQTGAWIAKWWCWWSWSWVAGWWCWSSLWQNRRVPDYYSCQSDIWSEGIDYSWIDSSNW